MKRRLVLRFGLLAIAVVFVAMLYAWLMSPARRINRATFDRIQKGMTIAEVDDLVGYPPGIHGSEEMIASKAGMTVRGVQSLMYVDATFHPRDFDSRVWASSGGLILIRFGDGVVEQKAFWDVEFSFRDMVQGWFSSFRK